MKMLFPIEKGVEGVALWIDAINESYTYEKFTTTKSQELGGWGDNKNKTVRKLLSKAEEHLSTLGFDCTGMYIMPEDVNGEQLWAFCKGKFNN